MSESIIKLRNVKKSIGDQLILKEITRDFEKGKIHGIIGLNGSGKTVLFKCICGFLQPDSGTIEIEGKKIGTEIDFPESLGIIIESPGFIPSLTGYANLKMLADVKRVIGKRQIVEAMERVGLDSNMKKSVENYSLGMRERLGIAQAIMENPNILVLDEPFNGLDKQGVKEVYQILRQLREKGTTILLASHNEKDIHLLCDKVYEMENGQLETIQP